MSSLWNPEDEYPVGPKRLTPEYRARLRLYNSGSLEYPLDTLIARWLTELQEQGLSPDWYKQDRDAASRTWPRGERPVHLENGETIWVSTDTLRNAYVRVLDEHLRTDRAIIAALTVLETFEDGTKALSEALVAVADAMRRGERFEVLPWREETSRVTAGESGAAQPDRVDRSPLPAPLTEHRRTLSYVRALVERRPDFDSLTDEEQCRFVARALERMTDIHRGVRGLAAFLEYGVPKRQTRPAVENAQRDIRAAQLRLFKGFSEVATGELLEMERSKTDKWDGGNSAVRKAAKSGEKLLRQALSEDEWREGLARGDAARRRRAGKA